MRWEEKGERFLAFPLPGEHSSWVMAALGALASNRKPPALVLGSKLGKEFSVILPIGAKSAK